MQMWAIVKSAIMNTQCKCCFWRVLGPLKLLEVNLRSEIEISMKLKAQFLDILEVSTLFSGTVGAIDTPKHSAWVSFPDISTNTSYSSWCGPVSLVWGDSSLFWFSLPWRLSYAEIFFSYAFCSSVCFSLRKSLLISSSHLWCDFVLLAYDNGTESLEMISNQCHECFTYVFLKVIYEFRYEINVLIHFEHTFVHGVG